MQHNCKATLSPGRQRSFRIRSKHVAHVNKALFNILIIENNNFIQFKITRRHCLITCSSRTKFEIVTFCRSRRTTVCLQKLRYLSCTPIKLSQSDESEPQLCYHKFLTHMWHMQNSISETDITRRCLSIPGLSRRQLRGSLRHMIICGSGTDSEISLCGSIRPPLMYSSSFTTTSSPRTDTFSIRAYITHTASNIVMELLPPTVPNASWNCFHLPFPMLHPWTVSRKLVKHSYLLLANFRSNRPTMFYHFTSFNCYMHCFSVLMYGALVSVSVLRHLRSCRHIIIRAAQIND